MRFFVVRDRKRTLDRSPASPEPELNARSERTSIQLPERRIRAGFVGDSQEGADPVAGRDPSPGESGRGCPERLNVLFLKIGLVVLLCRIGDGPGLALRAVEFQILE